MAEVYLSLGSNLGDRLANLKQAVELIKDFSQTELKQTSKVYQTEAWGYKDQADFLNLCLRLETKLSPYQLLDNCQLVEKRLKRKRKFRWGPRVIDVDILLYDDLSLKEPDLEIPHPRMHQRAFVLIPLLDLDQDLTIKGKKIIKYLAEIDSLAVKEYQKIKY